MNLIKASTKYLIDCQIRTSKENHQYETSKCKTLNKFIGKKNIKRINRDTLNQFILAYRDYNPNISNVSINKHIATLNRVLKYNIQSSVEFKKLKESRTITPTIPSEAISEIFEYLESRKFRGTGFRNLLFYRLLYDTGLRLKELRHFEVDNLNLENNSYLATTTKTDSERHVYFSDSTKSLIVEYITKYKIEKYLFIDLKTKTIVSTNSIENVAKRIRQKLNLPFSVSPHKWRHTFANEFSTKVNDLESLRIMVGHSNLSTTQRYLHHDDKHIKNQYMLLSDRRTEENNNRQKKEDI